MTTTPTAPTTDQAAPDDRRRLAEQASSPGDAMPAVRRRILPAAPRRAGRFRRTGRSRPTRPGTGRVRVGRIRRRGVGDGADAGTAAAAGQLVGRRLHLIAVALLQLTRLPEWIADDRHGLVSGLTGVVALVGIGIALILTGRERRR